MFKSILFVCVGNICRSPTAEYWARDQLTKKGFTDIAISSAGIHAMRDYAMEKEAQEILKQFNIDASAHRARQIEKKIIDAVEIVFVMETWQKEELAFAFPENRGKIFTLGKWKNEDIRDPYHQQLIVFEQVFESIKDNWGLWQSKLWNG